MGLKKQKTPKLKNLCLLSLLVGFYCLAALGQARTSGSIKGRVVNESGQPMANVRVLVRAVGATVMQEGNSTTTDGEGKFEVSGLEARSYQVVASRSAYTLLNTGDTSWQKYHRVGDFVTLVLTKGGVITGTVTTQTGEPIVGVRVYATLVSGGDAHSFPFVGFTPERFTDDRGVYRIYGLATGTYVVWAGGGSGMMQQSDAFDEDVPTYAPGSTRDDAMEISVRAGVETNNIDIRYRGEPSRTVSGKASRVDGLQQAGFGITLTAVGKNNVNWTVLTPQAPESKGFVFRGVDDGEYDVTAFSASNMADDFAITSKRIKVSGADLTGVELITRPLASISGRVVLEESKAPECSSKPRPLFGETLVTVVQEVHNPVIYHPQFRWMLSLVSTVDTQGNVTVKNLLPGKYGFVPEFAAKYWYVQSMTLPPQPPSRVLVDAARNWATLKSGDRITGLTITLAQGAASLHGQLALKEGQTLTEKSFVYLVPAEREKSEDVLRFFVAAVDEDGKVALSNIAPGRYLVLAKPESGDAVWWLTKLRSPDESEMRARLRREAETAKTEIELKPCQNVTGFPVAIHF